MAFAQLGWSVLEMHSRKSQPHRTRVADAFREGSNLVMFSSDVSARGMDYPDVVIGLTVLAYRYEGLRRTDFTSLLAHLKREMAAQVMCMACSNMHPMHVCTCASG